MKKTQPKPTPNVIEDIRTYPAGRGRVAQFIVRKRIPQKRGRFTKKPFYFLHFKQSHTPETVCVLQFHNSRPILLPEHLHMNQPDLYKLLAAALVLYNVQCSKFKHVLYTRRTHRFGKMFRIPHEIWLDMNRQIRRYIKWRDK